ncbi:hypothetical protein RvY_08390 [Ramazzottius varieornatus]|uniref:Uncharacterized protein n=1 Tax=Ramazzottius varieornatus TaxID=947166 RepID=A0A1D1VBA2_RAMVA|nr:hypothetical protein RvY_08390 [Ramazzottius varieornatus]
MDGSENMPAKDQAGSAVVFFHTVKAEPPATLVRAVALSDLRPTNRDLVRERGFCQVRVIDKWLPCIVVEINGMRCLDEEIVKVLEDEVHLERRGENIAMELGFSRVRRTVLDRTTTQPPKAVHGQHERLPVVQRSMDIPVTPPEVQAPNSFTAPSSSSSSPQSSPTVARSRPAVAGKSKKAATLFRDTMRSQPMDGDHHVRLIEREYGGTASTSRPEDSARNGRVGKGGDGGDLIYKICHSGFYSSNVHSKRPVSPVSKSLKDLPKTVFSYHYNQDINVAELRHEMWQRNTWQDASNEALHCLFSDADLTSSVPSNAGATMHQKNLLDPTRVNVIYELAGETCRDLYKTTLEWRDFGKNIGTHKSVLRSRLSLPRRRKRPHVKKDEVSKEREKKSNEEETDLPVRRKWSTVKAEMVKVKDAEDIHEEMKKESEK